VRFVEANAPGQARAQLVQQPLLDDAPFKGVAHLALGALDVAEVGEEDPRLGPDDRESAGAAEPRQPPKVDAGVRSGVAGRDEVAHDQRVEALLRDQRRQAVCALAAHPGISRFNSVSASR
jgi:hypothetical protein